MAACSEQSLALLYSADNCLSQKFLKAALVPTALEPPFKSKYLL